MLTTFLLLAVAMSAWMVLLWLIQWAKRDAGIVDAGWALGLGAAALYLGWFGPGEGTRRVLAMTLATAWALRLGLYLLFNRVVGRAHEDGRYARMRAAMGRWAQPGFLLFFQLQAGFVLIFALPLYAVAANPVPGLRWLDWLGLLIGLGAIVGETLADRQLARFRADPAHRGTTCRQGLWRYSRHPNYFFEILHWVGYALLAIGSPYWLLAATGPLVTFLFIWKLTGIPFVEQQARSHRPDYAEYQRTTSLLIPWPPRR
jgi:steroid 5-alpha reductase family enzyme